MSLNRLPNAFHFETVMKTLERVGTTNVPQQNAAFRPLYEDLMTKFQREDTAYKQSQKNFKSDQIRVLDEERDEYAECIRRVAEEWAARPTAAAQSSATRTRFTAWSKRRMTSATANVSTTD